MDSMQKKKVLNTLGSILIGIAVIWGAIGFKIRNLPYLLIILTIGCLFSYIGKRIEV